MNLEEATSYVNSRLLNYCIKQEFAENSREINFKFVKPLLVFLSQQTKSVPFGALLGFLVGSKQHKLPDAIQFMEAAIEEGIISVKKVNENWIVDPISIEHTVDEDLGIDVRPIVKYPGTAYCGKLLHNPSVSRIDHLQYLNNIKFNLNTSFINAHPVIPETAPFSKSLPGILKDAASKGTVYLDHKYDTRLRTYCASNVNYQGTEWEKCLVKFAKEETLTAEGIQNVKGYLQQLKPKEEYLRFTANQALVEGTTGKTGIFIGADASASGMQIISVLFKCITTATNVGILDSSKDAYTEADKESNLQVPSGMNSRDAFKQCCMQHSYGGTKTPKAILGEENYVKFRNTMWKLFPAVEYYVAGIPSIYHETEVFTWTLPDGAKVQQPVIETQKVLLHLPHYPDVQFGYAYKSLVQKTEGLEMAANIVHSIDGYIARELIYRAAIGGQVEGMKDTLICLDDAIKRSGGTEDKARTFSLYTLLTTDVDKWVLLGKSFLLAAKRYVQSVIDLDMPSFQVITIHDDFKCHPNYLKHVQWLYLEILSELADSTILRDIVMEINPKAVLNYASNSQDLASEIRKARSLGIAKGLT